MNPRLYAVAMTVHVLGLIALFAAFAMQQRAGAALRHARRYEEARTWADLLVVTRSMIPSGVVMLLVSGWYLASRAGRAAEPTALLATATVLFIGAAFVTVSWPGFVAIRKAIDGRSGRLELPATEAIGRTATWSAHSAANGAALGTIWVMTARPAMLEAVLVVVIPATVGFVAGATLASRSRRAAQPDIRPL